MKYRHTPLRGFALPTVLIASVVMLTVLTVAASSVAAVRTSVKAQYYEQLAKTAGEAGVAYAKACLAKSNNVPQWSDDEPLTPSTNCAGVPIADPPKYVLSTPTLRSSFSMGSPTLNSQGKALTLPHSGFVELLRTSNGAVWRTYRQPAVQAAVVPDLCSGAATSSLGWSNAAAASAANQLSLLNAPAAVAISASASAIPSGKLYFRKDFTITEAGQYQVSGLTKNNNDKVELFVDGVSVATSQGSLGQGLVSLTPGCHVIAARLTNKTISLGVSQFAASVARPGSTDTIVASDTSWRVSTGRSVHYSDPDYDVDDEIWTPVTIANTAVGALSTWTSLSGDADTQYVTPSCNATCTAASSTYFRGTNNIVLADNTEIMISAICDDECRIYIDGQLVVIGENQANKVFNQRVMTLTAGTHQIGARVLNTNTIPNPSALAISVKNTTNNAILARTDASWKTLRDVWFSGANDANDPWSYELGYRPSPADLP